MTTFVQSLSWALVQSFVQGVLVYVALSVLLWTIPASRSRLRYSLSFLAMVALSFLFVIAWWREFEVLTSFAATPVLTLSAASFRFAHSSAGAALLPTIFSSRFLSLLGGAYILGVLLMVVRLLIGVSHVVSLRSKGTESASDEANTMFRALRSKLEVAPGVRLLVSVRAHVPMVVGILKPVILLPAATVANLDAEQLEAILLHELAHVRRYDFLANILQAAMETLMFFNPFVWLISSRVRDERERCCDDIVVSMVGEPISYVTALTTVASYSRGGNTFALAATGRSGKLLARVQRIMEEQDFRLKYSRVIASILLLLLLMGSAAWIRPAFQQKSKKAAARVSATESTVDRVQRTQARESPVGQDVERVAGVEKRERRLPEADIKRQRVLTKEQPTALADENILVNRLLQDHVIDQVKGFLVERNFKDIYVNRQVLPEEVSSKYLQGLKKEVIRVQIFPLEERLRMHPDADLIQLLLPFTFESPCVKKPTAKEDC